MNRLYRKSLIVVFGLLLAATTPLFAQHPVEFERPVEKFERPVEKAVAHPPEEEGESASKKAEEWRKERSSTVDREYFGSFSSPELKKPFNQLVDHAIDAIISASSNEQVFNALTSQNQELPPPERLTLKLNEHWFLPDTIDVSKAGSSKTATVYAGTLKDYISDAIDKVVIVAPKLPELPEGVHLVLPGKPAPSH
jgi:hypothetical protein